MTFLLYIWFNIKKASLQITLLPNWWIYIQKYSIYSSRTSKIFKGKIMLIADKNNKNSGKVIPGGSNRSKKTNNNKISASNYFSIRDNSINGFHQSRFLCLTLGVGIQATHIFSRQIYFSLIVIIISIKLWFQFIRKIL